MIRFALPKCPHPKANISLVCTRWAVSAFTIYVLAQSRHNCLRIFLSFAISSGLILPRQNNSITDPSIRALATQVWCNHAELGNILIDIGQYADLTSSNTIPAMPEIENIVARTTNAINSVLDTEF
ncbi:uncharacterized protein BDZ99DRAFT_460516 [Mytilinidion resinicola]|uniref:Uncharacterized protein n=1 Tax=Mytilinidion resinicola TaxID=574789 RepID=A0A6A6YWU3_9PEZI|nr:uncharacterized protein BDZ99DRAFT_460516 [Mytilinidion resinicola]KAF2813240.1 hypothetical protein BDZ99DRAFT_460516 [Mytilinidion resinicola]